MAVTDLSAPSFALHPLRGPHEPTTSTPSRRPGSVRRTSSMDITRAPDAPDPVYLLGRARDLITGPDGSAQVARTAGLTATVYLIALQVLGDDTEALERFAEAAEKVIQPTPGAADVQMQREGVKPGVPDVCLPVPRKGWHGLFIELKFGANKPTDYQLEWLEQLAEQGYLAVVCYGWVEATEVIQDYLDIRGFGGT